MEQNPYINWKAGLEHLGEDSMLKTFLQKFQDETLYSSVIKMARSMQVRDWELLKREAHSLKGSSGYIGALKCHELSGLLQFSAQESPIIEEKVFAAFNELIQHCKELQQFLCKYFSKPYTDHEQVFDYRVEISTQSSKPNTPSNLPSYRPIPIKLNRELSTERKDSRDADRPSNGEGDSLAFTIRRLVPPTTLRTNIKHINLDIDLAEDEELDAYDELNKNWRCSLI